MLNRKKTKKSQFVVNLEEIYNLKVKNDFKTVNKKQEKPVKTVDFLANKKKIFKLTNILKIFFLFTFVFKLFFSFIKILKIIKDKVNKENFNFLFVNIPLTIKNKEIKKKSLREKFLSFKKCREKNNENFFSKEKFNIFFSKIIPKWEKNVLKPIVILFFFFCLIILPFKFYDFYLELFDLKGKVLGASEIAVNDMLQGADSLNSFDIKSASDDFLKAQENFLKAQTEISGISKILAIVGKIVPNEKAKLASYAENVLSAGELSAKLANELVAVLGSLEKENLNLTDIINDLSAHSFSAYQYSQELDEIIQKINAQDLPAEYQEKFLEVQEKSKILKNSLGELVYILEKAKIFLGFDTNKRYLLVFQNNTELRASGGFIGSYALADFKNGKIVNLEVPGGGSYDTEAGLLDKIIAPKPLHLVNPLWHFWDANWWPDWKMSARKLMWFYEKSDGPTVDGVLSFTPTTLEEILKIIGPIDMTQDYGVVIDANNFWSTVQTFSEQKPDVTKKPKKIIGDLMTKIIDKLKVDLNKKTLLSLADAMERSLAEKHILFYFQDDSLQKLAEDFDWAGRVRETSWDYLMLVNTNIAGGKSDKKIKEEIKHNVEIMEDGSVIDTLEIKRTHTGFKNEEFVGVRNVDWLRVYVPKGSQLIQANGFLEPDSSYFERPSSDWQEDKDVFNSEGSAIIDFNSKTKIYEEFNKTVFANWVMVDPAETVTILLKYKLPFKIEQKQEEQISAWKEMFYKFVNKDTKNSLPYSLLVQKQPGSIGSVFSSELKTNLKITWFYGVDGDKDWKINSVLDKDKYWAILLE